MIVLSKANLVDEGTDLDQIKNSIGSDSIVIGKSIRDDFRPFVQQLQEFHYKIQKVLTINVQFYLLFIE